MVDWTCPNCGARRFSAAPRPEEQMRKCEECGEKFENPYYQGKPSPDDELGLLALDADERGIG